MDKNTITLILTVVVLAGMFAGEFFKGTMLNILQWLGILSAGFIVFIFVIKAQKKPKKELTVYDEKYKEVYEEKRKAYLIEKAEKDAERDARDTRTQMEKIMDRFSGR